MIFGYLVALVGMHGQQLMVLSKLQPIAVHQRQLFCFQQSLRNILSDYQITELDQDELMLVSQQLPKQTMYIRYQGSSIYMAKARGGHFVLLTTLRTANFSRISTHCFHIMVIFKDGFKAEEDIYI